MRFAKAAIAVIALVAVSYSGCSAYTGAKNLYGDWEFLRASRIQSLRQQAARAQQQQLQQQKAAEQQLQKPAAPATTDSTPVAKTP